MIVTLYGGPAAGQSHEVAEPPPPELLVPVMPEQSAAFFTEPMEPIAEIPYKIAVYRRSPWHATHYHHEVTR